MEELRESLKLLKSAYSRLKEALAIEEKSDITSHTYNREIALSVYETVLKKHQLFQELIDKLSRELPR